MSEFVLAFVAVVPIAVVITRSLIERPKIGKSLELPVDSCEAFRGYMALMILWGHDTGGFYWTNGSHYYPYPFVMSALRKGMQDTGFLFVGAFFALSACGCRKKLLCGEDKMTGFLQKRVKSVWMPFVLIGTMGFSSVCSIQNANVSCDMSLPGGKPAVYVG